MKTFSNASITILCILLVGCGSGGGSDSGNVSVGDNNNGQQTVDAGDTANPDGSGTNNSPGNDTGGVDSGNNDGGVADGGGSGEDSTPGSINATLASLYSTQNIPLTLANCNSIASQNETIYFAQAVLRVITQEGNAITAVLTLTPTDQSLANQLVLRLSGVFSNPNDIKGDYNAIATINGQVIDSTSGEFAVLVYVDSTQTLTSLNIGITQSTDVNDCHISGSIGLDEENDPGSTTGGGGSGSGSSGGTGGDSGTGGNTGGNTGGSGSPIMITEEGDFGSLQFQSSFAADDNQQFSTTSATFMRMETGDFFVWGNGDNVAVQVNLITGNSAVISFSGKDYACICFPLIDLINREVTFNNFTLTKVTESLTINGSLSFPQFNQQ